MVRRPHSRKWWAIRYALKLSENSVSYALAIPKQNVKLTKDSIGDCAVVIVGLALLIKEDVHAIFEESDNIRDVRMRWNVLNC